MFSLLISFVLCSSLIEAARFRCDYSYFKMEDFEGWLKFHRRPTSWHEARLRCHLEGAMLASPTTTRLRSAMIAMLRAQKYKEKEGIFTGIHATFSAGDFSSIDGVSLTTIQQNWIDGEPDNCDGIENCLVMTPDGLLADADCKINLPYLCYKKKTENTFMSECGSNDNGYTLDKRTGSCYKFHRVLRSWSRAYMTCNAEGGHLVIINSDTEAQVIKDIYAKNPPASILGNIHKDYAHVGFHDWGEHGEFLTIHGETLSEAGYSKFANGEPNSFTTREFCGSVNRMGFFNDMSCEAECTFICEKNPQDL